MRSVAEIEQELTRIRIEEADGAPVVRASTMTHLAWVPERWLEAARATLAGLGERHPSRTILLLPQPDAEDGIEAEIRVERFGLEGLEQLVCTEVIELRLGGRAAQAPASVVLPLLRSDLPVFLRWRGRPTFGAPELEQLLDVADRLIVDSVEWEDVEDGYGRLVPTFEQAAVSDIAWARILPWRVALAELWPGIGALRTISVTGPLGEALLLAGWLRSRLDREIELVHESADTVRAVAVDGTPAQPADLAPRSPSDLLSDQLDQFGHDRVYKQAVRAAVAA